MMLSRVVMLTLILQIIFMSRYDVYLTLCMLSMISFGCIFKAEDNGVILSSTNNLEVHFKDGKIEVYDNNNLILSKALNIKEP